MTVSPNRHALLYQSCWRAGDVQQDVPIPPHYLLEEDPQKQDYWSIFTQLIQFAWLEANLGSISVATERDIVEVLVHMSGVDMVSSVSRLPGEVRRKER
jgi:hypothetical protein